MSAASPPPPDPTDPPDDADDSAPDPAPGSTRAPDPALSAGAVNTLCVATVLCPLLVGAILGFGWFSTLYSPRPMAPEILLQLVAIASAVIGVAHCLVLAALHHQGVPRPWEFPTILSTASVLGLAQMALTESAFGLELYPTPFSFLLMAMPGAIGWGLTRHRRGLRLPLALALVVATASPFVGMAWRDAEHAHQQRREELLSDVADYPLVIAVLDSPRWEPSNMGVGGDPHRITIDYVPIDPSPELDGVSITLHSEVLREEMRWTLREGCDPRGGTWLCVEHGNAVIATDWEGYAAEAQVRVEVTHGIIARLTVYPPDDYHDEYPDTEFPDIDLADLSERIRLAEPGEAEEIASAVTD